MKITAAFFLALMTMASPTEAMTVTLKVGPLLQQAQQMIAAKNYKAALAKLDEAEAVKAYPDDEAVINEFRRAVAVASANLSPSQPNCTSDRMAVTKCDGRPATGAQP